MNLKRLYIVIALAFFSVQGSATHLLGGEIIWKCKPNGKYQFSLVLYRDCGGIALGTGTQTIANNAGVAISASYVSTTDVVRPVTLVLQPALELSEEPEKCRNICIDLVILL